MKEIDYRPSQQDDDGYEAFLASVRARFASLTGSAKHVFTTDAEGLMDAFLGSLPTERRQHYTCNACRHFVERFGGIVVIDAGGSQRPVMWDTETAPAMFSGGVEAIDKAVRRAKVTGVFLSDLKDWGQHTTGPWNHLAVRPPLALLCKHDPLKTPGQRMAERREEYGMLQRGLHDFPIGHVRRAKALLETDSLYRGEKVLGVATWLLELHERIASTRDSRARDNLVWLAVASAPPGWCHVRSTMIGTLLEDLGAGLPFDGISRKFKEKMNGLQYQRPQAAPTEGQIDAAEKAIEKLGVTRSLRRRFAKLEDLQTIWTPKTQESQPESHGAGGAFAHLRQPVQPGVIDTGAPPTTMTWVKFAAEVLPKAERIDMLVPYGGQFVAHVTACDPEAPNLLQWNNPVDWYVYQGGSIAERWNLQPGTMTQVTAIALAPHLWPGNPPMPHQQSSVALILAGARDMGYVRGALFFPESLRSDYHAIRAVIEAHSKRGVLGGKDEATACGYNLLRGASWDVVVYVTAGGVRMGYRLDRWD